MCSMVLLGLRFGAGSKIYLELREIFLDLPGLAPELDLAFQVLGRSLARNPLFKATTAPDEGNILAAKFQDTTEVIFTVTGIADAVILGMVGNECRQFFTFAHVRATANLALMLGPIGVDPAPDLEEARFVPLGRVGGDLVEDVGQFLVLKNC